jgi:mannose/cellobiose epimerase-like protein (N-acyl-D-glucosamine 2-epimerase family)
MNIYTLASKTGLRTYQEQAPGIDGVVANWIDLEAFAALVAAHEREECAKLCEALRETIWAYHEEHLKAAACNVCTNLAISIRARGTT